MKAERYTHLYRDKWLKVDPVQIYGDYYDHEYDNRVAHDHYEIVISESCPGVLVGDNDPVMRGKHGR